MLISGDFSHVDRSVYASDYKLAISTSLKSFTPGKGKTENPHPGQGKVCKIDGGYRSN